MKVGMYSLFSPIHDEEAISQTLEQFIKDLGNNIEIEEIDDDVLSSQQKDEYDLITVFVKTGGTENLFKDIFDKLDGQVILVATSLHNSLAASMEILSWVKSQDRKGKILHGTPNEIANEMRNLIKIRNTKEKIKNSTMGLIGEPSDWLIDSHVDKEAVKKQWGLEIVDIPIKEVIEEYQNIQNEKANDLIDKFTSKAISIEEPTENDLTKAAKVYFALKNIVSRYNLNALTIRCFDLVTELETTGCLALSLLNNDGIVAGCEGDVPAAVSMMITYYLTDNIPFMANPVSLNTENNKVKFAHCTVATKSVENYMVRSHFETGIGVGIQGEIKKGDITVFKVGGSNLDHLAFKDAKLINNLNSEFACRTQVLVDFENSDINYFLKNPIGNHHILVEGNHYNLIQQFVESLDFDPIIHW